MTEPDELLDVGPRRRLPLRALAASLAGVGVLGASAVVAFAPPVLAGHGSAHVAPRPQIVQPLKGDFLS